jgi:hypothetical protein
MLKAAALREEGKTYPEIAQALGIGVMTAYRDVWNYLDAANEQDIKDAAALRVREVAKVDKVIARLWRAVEDEDHEIAIKASGTLIKALERRAKYLPGVEVPTKVEVKNEPAQMTREQLIGRARELIAKADETQKEIH